MDCDLSHISGFYHYLLIKGMDGECGIAIITGQMTTQSKQGGALNILYVTIKMIIS